VVTVDFRELREKYISFFESKNHKRIASSSLIPENDPTVLFTTAGMHPLVPYLTGQVHPLGKRLVNFQKCIRTGDIEEVGDSSHLTFFEMLGNWSLGDYFKKEAISWSFEFLTKILGFNKNQIHVTVFEGDNDAPRDDESAGYWKELGIETSHIHYKPKEDNWWGPAGLTGPCGPDTEMFIDTGKPSCSDKCSPGCRCGKYIEIWNDVFMQYNKNEDGSYSKLQQHNVDTGMGIERTVAMLTGKKTVYETNCEKNSKNIERRVKKYIKSKNQLFFAVFPPVFQDQVVKKFKENNNIEIVEESKGGIEFAAKIEDFYQILSENLGVVRYLLRIKKFSCKNFQKLYSYIEKIDWDLYLPVEVDLSINVTTNNSRLYHSDAVAERVKDAIMKNRKQGIDKVTIYIRIDHDIVNVSLDIVGEPLFKRGWKNEFVRAPIRENLANLILSEIDLDKYQTFCDPMCGSGTFIFEILFLKRIIFPFNRSFNFEKYPFYSEKTYLYNKKKYLEKKNDPLVGNDEKKVPSLGNVDEFRFIANDINLSSFQKNLDFVKDRSNNLNNRRIGFDLSENDFFDLDLVNLLEKNKSLVVFNPPYGQRISINNEKKYFEKINDKIRFFKDNGIDTVIVIPDDKLKYLNGYSKKVKFKNGNIPVDALYYL